MMYICEVDQNHQITRYFLIYFLYNKVKQKMRIGAKCKDGTYTTATGRGAGSHHGGVKQWIYADTKPQNTNNFTSSNYQPEYKNSYKQPEYQKPYYQPEQKKPMGFEKETTAEKAQKIKIKELESLTNKLQAQNKKISQDLIDNKNLSNKLVNQLTCQVKEKQKQVTQIQKEKNRIQLQNKWYKQSMNKLIVDRQNQNKSYEGRINELCKRCKTLQKEILESRKKQISDVQIQKRIEQRCKQLKEKLQKDYKKQTDLILQKIQRLKQDINEKQTKFNSQRERYKEAIDSLKQQLKQQINSFQQLKQKYAKYQKQLKPQKYEQNKDNLHYENIQKINQSLKKQFQSLKLNHQKDIINFKKENQKLNQKLIHQKEIRTQQVNRVKTLLTGKHQKQIKTLQENHKLKQKLWIIESNQPQRMIVHHQNEEEIQNQQRQIRQSQQKQLNIKENNKQNQDPQFDKSNSIKEVQEKQLQISENKSKLNLQQNNQKVQSQIIHEKPQQTSNYSSISLNIFNIILLTVFLFSMSTLAVEITKNI